MHSPHKYDLPAAADEAGHAGAIDSEPTSEKPRQSGEPPGPGKPPGLFARRQLSPLIFGRAFVSRWRAS